VPEVIFWRDRFCAADEVRIPPFDRGHNFGDGIYEYVRAYGGRPFMLAEHLARFERSAREIRMDPPLPRERLDEIVREAIARAGGDVTDAYFQATRGAPAFRNHPFPEGAEPIFFLHAKPARARTPEERARGVSAVLAPDERWARCDIKSLNLLPNVLAAQKAKEAGAYEAIFVRDGRVTECAHSSVLAVMEDVLRTAPLTDNILPSITRAEVLRLAREEGVPVEERAFSPEELRRATECIIASTVAEVLPCVQVDASPVGDGKPGPVTRRLAEAFDELTGSDGA